MIDSSSELALPGADGLQSCPGVDSSAVLCILEDGRWSAVVPSCSLVPAVV